MSPTYATSNPRPFATSGRHRFQDEPILLHAFFEGAVSQWPDRVAIDVPPGSGRPTRRTLTYAELKRESDALAHFLRDFVKEECVVALLLPRDSEHLYVAQLAVLKAGAAYACIDRAFPDEQLCTILDDSRAVALLADTAGLARARRLRPDVECFVNVAEFLDDSAGPDTVLPPAPWLGPDSLAYLIYTSGTTGRPKGVMIEHRSIVNLVRGNLQEFDLSPNDRVGQSSSCAYDSSVEEVWLALSTGATLVVMDDETTRLGPDLVPWLRRERITVFDPTPTLLRSTGCLDPQAELPELRFLYVGGEALPQDLADRWAAGRLLVNAYGPTECTVTALRAIIEPGDSITIGRPVPGVQAWVLNDAFQIVDDGEQGELCIGVGGLARGYMNHADLTAQKFPMHPRLGRIYRSGDLVHRGRDGNFYFHGRIDSQVKVRGYRIELEAIEARLVECAGVREAACRVQGEGPQKKLVAFLVPSMPAAPPSFEYLKAELHKVLPEYMVPAHFGLLQKLPTSAGGKLNRKLLPTIDVKKAEANGPTVAPRTPLEEKLALAFGKTLNREEAVSVDLDFFHDLGGDSLMAAQVISRLRDDPVTASYTVRDLYEARTVAELAKRAHSVGTETVLPEDHRRPAGRPFLATVVQVLWLGLGLLLGAPIAYVVPFLLVPYLWETLGLTAFLLLAPVFSLAGIVIYTLASAGLVVLVKKILIGRYRPCRAPVWGSFYVRAWMVQQAARLVPWSLLEGTVFAHVILRALGARIGRRVHIHRGVNLRQGGWDLLDIGDDVTLSQDAALRLVELEDGQIVVAPIRLEDGCTLDVRAGLAGNTCVEAGAYLAPLSFLSGGSRIPRGQRWDGVPASAAGEGPARPALPTSVRELSPAMHGVVMLLARAALWTFIGLPAEGLALALVLAYGVDADNAAEWLFNPTIDSWGFVLGMTVLMFSVPLVLLFQAMAMRLLGSVPPGVISRWSLAYVRVWLKTGTLESASHWLSGTLFWPTWLRWAGMKVGRGCEISTITDTVPELVDIGMESFFADGIYLGGPRIDRGTVTLASVRLGKNTFLGNHVMVGAGQHLPNDVLLGVCTVADDKKVRAGTSWFGHPKFELPNREVVEYDRSFTHEPTWGRYLGRVFWELARFALPLAPLLITVLWFELLAFAEAAVTLPVLLLAVIPALELGVIASLCVFVLALKWMLLGRVRPGVHPLWSCWCARWDFLYIAWAMYAQALLSPLEGTLLLNWYLRAMGMRIGRNVILGNGCAHVVDPDMLEFEDGATVNCQFQAHTFEDRVLKIDHVKIRRQATVGNLAVLLYGADVGVRTQVAPHSVVMKRERLLPGRSYAGCPTQCAANESAGLPTPSEKA